MKKFLFRLSIFVLIQLIFFAVTLLYLDIVDSRLNPLTSATESALLSIPEKDHAEILIMGSSHGRMFSRGSCHDMMEKIYNCTVHNISKSAAGPVPEFEFLKQYFNRGNDPDTIVYFIDGFVFYSEKWNEDLYFLADEPFQFEFFWQVLFSEISLEVKYNYIKTKFERDWRWYNASRAPDITGELQKVDTVAVRKRLEADYPDGIDQLTAERYKDYFKKIIELAKDQGCTVIFVLPPTLLGNDPGLAFVRASLLEFERDYGVRWFDHSEVIPDPKCYYNHDHLNLAGVWKYLNNFLLLDIRGI